MDILDKIKKSKAFNESGAGNVGTGGSGSRSNGTNRTGGNAGSTGNANGTGGNADGTGDNTLEALQRLMGIGAAAGGTGNASETGSASPSSETRNTTSTNGASACAETESPQASQGAKIIATSEDYHIENDVFVNLFEGPQILHIPNGIVEVGYLSLYCDEHIEEVYVGKSVKTIASSAFEKCLRLKTVILPEGLVEMRDEVFRGCPLLQTLEIPASVQAIGKHTFSDCPSLSRITTASESVAQLIRNSGYEGPIFLTQTNGAAEVPQNGPNGQNGPAAQAEPCGTDDSSAVNSPASDDVLTALQRLMTGDYATGTSTASASSSAGGTVNSPKGIGNDTTSSGTLANVTATYRDPFLDFKMDGTTITEYIGSATRVRIPAGATKIQGRAFFKHRQIKAFETDAHDSNFITIDDVLYAKGHHYPRATLVAYPPAKRGSTFVVDQSSVGDYAFCHAASLETIDLRHSLGTIGDCAFKDCTLLQHIILPSDLKLGRYAFCNCPALQEVELPDGLKTIPEYAFDQCISLRTVRFPKRIHQVGTGAFRGCASLQQVQITLEPERFRKATIDSWAFEDCTSLQAVEILGQCGGIEQEAFKGCTALRAVKMPEGIREIGEDAFRGCKDLTTINLPASLEKIGKNAFAGTSPKRLVPANRHVLELLAASFS